MSFKIIESQDCVQKLNNTTERTKTVTVMHHVLSERQLIKIILSY